MDLKSWRSIIHASTRSQVLCWPSVQFHFSHLSLLLIGLFTVLHPYYKLAYIKLSSGGPKEQMVEIAARNLDVKDWQDEAKNIVENTVHPAVPFDVRYSTNHDTNA